VSEKLLQERYGRGKTQKRDRAMVIGLGSIFLIAFLIWAVVFVVQDANRVTHRDIGYTILSESRAEIIFEVTRKPGAKVSCTLQVLNQNFAIVGYKTLEIAPSQSKSQVISTTINTTELGVSGLVDECR
jgi:hypothetical protein